MFKYHAFIFCMRPPRWRSKTRMKNCDTVSREGDSGAWVTLFLKIIQDIQYVFFIPLKVWNRFPLLVGPELTCICGLHQSTWGAEGRESWGGGWAGPGVARGRGLAATLRTLPPLAASTSLGTLACTTERMKEYLSSAPSIRRENADFECRPPFQLQEKRIESLQKRQKK
jgi:hypothetical protein